MATGTYISPPPLPFKSSSQPSEPTRGMQVVHIKEKSPRGGQDNDPMSYNQDVGWTRWCRFECFSWFHIQSVFLHNCGTLRVHSILSIKPSWRVCCSWKDIQFPSYRCTTSWSEAQWKSCCNGLSTIFVANEEPRSVVQGAAVNSNWNKTATYALHRIKFSFHPIASKSRACSSHFVMNFLEQYTKVNYTQWRRWKEIFVRDFTTLNWCTRLSLDWRNLLTCLCSSNRESLQAKRYQFTTCQL